MKMWISAYALSSGIRNEEGHLNTDGDYFTSGLGFYPVGKHAHETRDAALAAAEAARIKKIASLKKQIAKLEKMKFVAEDEA